jgi:glucose/arabinose dehydrogenase
MNRLSAVCIVLIALLTACAEHANTRSPDRYSAAAGYGPDPVLPPPDPSLIPVINIAPAVGWPAGRTPVPASGLIVQEFAAGLDHPRWLYVLPGGDVLVAESNAPSRPDDGQGIRGWFQEMIKKRAGAGVASANRITLLRDADGDGHAEQRSVLLKSLNSPFGMVFLHDVLYVANTDAILAFPYREGVLEITDPGRKLAPLPAGSINHHWTKNLIASADGKTLFVTVGSNSNVAENGLDAEEYRAAILQVDVATGNTRIYASGLRNPNGMDLHPKTGVLWTVVNERDEIGDRLVPDYLTAVQDGGFYGWPWSYFGANIDSRVQPSNPERVQAALKPDYALGAHTGSLGLTFYRGNGLPATYRDGAYIGQHGSWNRDELAGYRVLFVPFSEGRPSGMPVEILSGFINENGEAYGRPVGVVIDRQGALLVADDTGNRIWRVTAP